MSTWTTEEGVAAGRVPATELHPTLPVVLRAAATRFADAELIVTPEARMTYGEAELRSRLLARRLLAAGIGKGSRVAMQFPYGPDFLVAWFAVGRIGALVCALSTAYTPDEVAGGLRRSDAELLLIPSQLIGRDELAWVREAVPGLPQDGPLEDLRIPEVPFLRRVWVFDSGDQPDVPEVPESFLEAVEGEVSPADWLVLIQTSGSTAEPKGVLHTHGAILRRTAQGSVPGSGVGRKMYLGMPFFWVGGVLVLGGALYSGTTIVAQERFHPDTALDLIEREQCVAVSGWISMMHALRTHPSLPDRNLPEIMGITTSAYSGGNDQAPAYVTPLGMTESMGPHMTIPHPIYGMNPPDHLRGSLGIGNVGYEHALFDVDTGEIIAGDGEGELGIRGYAVTVGMYKREREDVFDADGWYHTGDRVRRVEDLFWFTGRTTEMIKTRGSNVAPPEVEACIEKMPAVRHGFVLGIPHPKHDEQVAAVVVPHPGEKVTPDEVREHVGALLSGYKVPQVVLVLDDAEVPWLGTGKPDKRAMKPLLEKLATSAEG